MIPLKIMARQAICLHLLLHLIPASAAIDWGRESTTTLFLPRRYATPLFLPAQHWARSVPRGGSDSYSDDQGDIDDTETPPITSSSRQYTPRLPHTQDERTASPTPSRRRSAPAVPSRNRGNPSQSSTSSSNVLTSMARKSVQLGTSLVTGTAQQTGKAAYYLVQPKHVDRNELFGLWRIDQQWNNAGRPAEHINIELTARGDVVVSAPGGTRNPPEKASSVEGRPPRLAPWKFTPAQWPKRAKIEFRMGPSLLYKCSVHRKLAAKNVLKLRGKIYRLDKTGWRGRNTSQVLVGTFVARRRLRLDEDEVDEEEEEEEVDQYEDEEEQLRDLNPIPDDFDDVDRDSDDGLEDQDEGAYDQDDVGSYDQDDDP